MAEEQVCEYGQEWDGNAAWEEGSSLFPARAHLGHIGVGLWRLGEWFGGRRAGHFPGLARLPASVHGVWGGAVTALGEGPGYSVPGGSPGTWRRVALETVW